MSGQMKGVNTEKHIQKVFNMKSIEKLWFKLQKVSMVKWGCQADVNLVGDVMKTSKSETISILWSFFKLSMIYNPYFSNVMKIDFFSNKMSSLWGKWRFLSYWSRNSFRRCSIQEQRQYYIMIPQEPSITCTCIFSRVFIQKYLTGS